MSSSWITALYSKEYKSFMELGADGFFRLPERHQYELLYHLPSPGALLSECAMSQLHAEAGWQDIQQRSKSQFVPTSQQLRQTGDSRPSNPLREELDKYSHLYRQVIIQLKDSRNESLRNLARALEKRLDDKLR